MANYKYNTTQIEQWGVDAVANVLSQTDTLRRFIKENDKTPLWDGEVFIYNDNNWNNENLVGKVSIQVKGKVVPKKELTKESVSFSVRMVDMKHYQTNRGTIYFVVLIDKNDTTQRTVFYETLTPQKTRTYIKGIEYQESCTIKLKKLPAGKYEAHSIFYNFYQDSIYGDIPSISFEELSLRTDIVKITANTVFFSPNRNMPSPIDVLLNNELYWKAEIAGYPISIPIEWGHDMAMAIVSKEGIPSILVNGEKYENYVSVTKTKWKSIIQFGESTTLTITKGIKGAKMAYSHSNSLANRIKDLVFIISVAETSVVTVEGDQMISLGNMVADETLDVNLAKKGLEYYKRIEKFWESLKITQDFEIGNIDSNSSLKELNLIMDSISGRKAVHVNTDGEHKGYLYRKSISNFEILFFLDTVDEEKKLYNIHSFFDYNGIIKICRGDTENITSRYSVLSPDDYIELSNIDFSSILQSYKDILHLNNNIYEPANYDLLNLLLAYDKHKGHPAIILNTAKEIASWLREDSGDVLQYEIKTLNYLQTIKRERELNDSENIELQFITEKSNNLMFKLAANLLLENYKIARLQFEELDEQSKEGLKSYPIYKFWK